MKRSELRAWWYRYAGSLAFVALVLLAGGGLLYVQHFSNALRDGLVEACERNGNPLRAIVTEQLEDQLEQSHTTDYEEFFPDVPESQLHALIHQQNQRLRMQIEALEPVDCEALYPS